MRYQILKPVGPFDPRRQVFRTLEALLDTCPPLVDARSMTEREAVDAVRLIYPEALAMPLPVTLGDGTRWLMGIVDSRAEDLNIEGAIPYSLVVLAIPEHQRDKHRIATYSHFTQWLWTVPPQQPVVSTSKAVAIEVRGGDMDSPRRVTALVGRTASGIPVIAFELDGVRMSIGLPRSSALTVHDLSEQPRTTDGHEHAVGGGSYDPRPR